MKEGRTDCESQSKRDWRKLREKEREHKERAERYSKGEERAVEKRKERVWGGEGMSEHRPSDQEDGEERGDCEGGGWEGQAGGWEEAGRGSREKAGRREEEEEDTGSHRL